MAMGPILKRLLTIAAAFILITLIAEQVFPHDGPLAAQKQPGKKPYTFTVDVGLVVLPVTVLDKSGRCVPGLEEKDFTVYEDGVPQHIQIFDQKDIPVAAGIVIDDSTSMAPKSKEVAVAALELVESSNPQDQIFVIHFHEHVSFSLRLGEAFTSNLEELRKAAFNASANGKTALYDAVIAGLEHVQESKLSKRVLVIVSDGGDNASRHTLKEALDMAETSNTLIYSIGIYDEYDRDRNPKVLKRFASITGGEAFFPDSITELPGICRHIASNIRTQYTLGYIPSNQKKDGTYRSIRVSVHAPDRGRLKVRTRSGYLVPNDKYASSRVSDKQQAQKAKE
jgi:Ca-activated chloride channel family protein